VSAGLSQILVAPDQFQRTVGFGVACALVTAAWLVLGPLLALSDTRTVWRCAAGASLASLSMGLLGDVGLRQHPLALVQFAAAALVLLSSAATLRRSAAGHLAPTAIPAPTMTRPSRWTAAAGAVVLGIGIVATGSAMAAQASAARSASAPAMAGMSTGSMSGSQYWENVAGGPFHPTGKTRTYFISADEVVWDYAPTGENGITGQPFDDVANIYVQRGPARIGSQYLKCVYRGYSDATFDTLKARPAQDAYLGFLGPVIRAEVGDTIKVVFRNTCRIPTSVHPHDVLYTKDSEGAPYNDGTTGADRADDSVPTGGMHTYLWQVPERAGPGPEDGSSIMSMYHSHTDEVSDTYAGLIGFMEITARGMARADGSPKDVDREIFENFMVGNENGSPYLQANIDRFAEPPAPDPEDEDFEESNLMHNINGYVFGNQPLVTLQRGERVRWYLMSMGTEVDQHTPHWHGNDVLVSGMRMDVVSLMPATMITADMVPDDVGIWLFHCHVGDHITAGMLTRYQVIG
jgi:manganese oxidase